jgi:hypothetical protein
MEDSATVSVQRTTAQWWTVTITGTPNDATMDELIRSYSDVLKSGIRRVCLDLTNNNPVFTLVHRRTPEVLQVAMKFERVAVLVSESKTAFAIKAATRVPEEGFRVFYDAGQKNSWLNE